MNELSKRVSNDDYQKIKEFVGKMPLERLEISPGKGRVPSLGIGLRGQDAILFLGANGIASIAYYNVNAKPYRRLLAPDKRRR